jgi:hypothetical protein
VFRIVNGVASPRAARPFAPLPRKRRAAWARGTPWLAKLGSRHVLVKPSLWTAVFASWGRRGVSLWIPVHAGVDYPDNSGDAPT